MLYNWALNAFLLRREGLCSSVSSGISKGLGCVCVCVCGSMSSNAGLRKLHPEARYQPARNPK